MACGRGCPCAEGGEECEGEKRAKVPRRDEVHRGGPLAALRGKRGTAWGRRRCYCVGLCGRVA